jgi:hypothetical protein
MSEEKTSWFRSARRVGSDDVMLKGPISVKEITAVKHTRDEYGLLFDNGQTMLTNSAFMLDRDCMERYVAESFHQWLQGPEDFYQWSIAMSRMAGLPDPEPPTIRHVTPPAIEPSKPTIESIPQEIPYPNDAQVFTDGQSFIATSYTPPQS